MRESNIIEFKEMINKTLLKTVSAYANFYTGKILFCVNDDGETVGVKNPDQDCLDIEDTINDYIKPKPDFVFRIDKL